MLILIKGAGDLASGTALRLFHAGFIPVMTELEKPTSVRRTVCFSEAVYAGTTTVEGVSAEAVRTIDDAKRVLAGGRIPVIIKADAELLRALNADIIVDAIMAKKNTGTKITDAKVVIALGPGFTAGSDCHAVVETMRGHTLGRLILNGSAIPDTGIPGEIGGYGTERLLRTPCKGIFRPLAKIGDEVTAGQTVAQVEQDGGAVQPVKAAIKGILRGILPDGLEVYAGMKAGDVDPRCRREHCFTVSDKSLAVAGGVLEGVLMLY